MKSTGAITEANAHMAVHKYKFDNRCRICGRHGHGVFNCRQVR